MAAKCGKYKENKFTPETVGSHLYAQEFSTKYFDKYIAYLDTLVPFQGWRDEYHNIHVGFLLSKSHLSRALKYGSYTNMYVTCQVVQLLPETQPSLLNNLTT